MERFPILATVVALIFLLLVPAGAASLLARVPTAAASASAR
jgi:hypothetical protein